MRYPILALCFLIFAGGQAVAFERFEEIAHTVVQEDGDIQIRDYAETVVAEVTVQGSRHEAPSKAFRTLFDYISGENTAAQEISMTAPVSQEQSQQIPMTIPVSQQQADAGAWSIAFHMPNDMVYEATPKPKDSRIHIRAIPARRMASITFSGTIDDSNVEKYEGQLRRYLEANGIEFEDDPVYAFYSGPMTPWFLRRNEVMFPLK